MQNRGNVLAIAGIIAATIIVLACIMSTTVVLYAILPAPSVVGILVLPHLAKPIGSSRMDIHSA